MPCQGIRMRIIIFIIRQVNLLTFHLQYRELVGVGIFGLRMNHNLILI